MSSLTNLAACVFFSVFRESCPAAMSQLNRGVMIAGVRMYAFKFRERKKLPRYYCSCILVRMEL